MAHLDAHLNEEGDAPVSVERSLDDKNEPVVTIIGELDLSNVASLRAVIEEIILERPRKVALEIAGLEFIDSSGIAVLVEAAQAIETVELRGASDLVRRVFEATGLNDIFRFEQ